jgi:hypothetical protein
VDLVWSPSASLAEPLWPKLQPLLRSANNAAWGAKLPTVEEFSEADCAGELTGLYGVETDANAAADPRGRRDLDA